MTVPKPTKGPIQNQSEELREIAPENHEDKSVKLKKNVDLFSGIALIVGTMIGSGIFVSPTGLLERTGSIQYSLLVWGLCGVVSMFGNFFPYLWTKNGPKLDQEWTKNGSKIDQISIKNEPKLDQEWTKNGSKIDQKLTIK